MGIHLGSESLSSFEQMGTPDKNCWTCVQDVSHSPVFWADHWQERLNSHPACESLQCLRKNQNHWWEWLNMCPACESLPGVWADQKPQMRMAKYMSSKWVALECFKNHWWEWLNLYLVCESLSSVWARATNKNGWTHIQFVSCSPVFKTKPLTIMAEYVSSLWVSLQPECLRTTEEWLNSFPACEYSPVNHW